MSVPDEEIRGSFATLFSTVSGRSEGNQEMGNESVEEAI
jgi:hypothetical protein